MENDPIVKAKQLIEILKYFKSIDNIKLPKGIKCPFDIGYEWDNGKPQLSHDSLAQATAGLGYIRWNCPFCGEHFEE